MSKYTPEEQALRAPLVAAMKEKNRLRVAEKKRINPLLRAILLKHTITLCFLKRAIEKELALREH